MKAAFATDDFETITGHVGRCNGFMIFESDNDSFTFIENRENSFTNHGRGHHNHGEHGHHHGEHEHHNHGGGHQRLIDGLKDCDYLVFNHGGFRLIDDLKKNGIQPILTSLTDPKIAMQQLISGSLISNEDLTCNHNH
jgi:predicted Fe-Mo cluster-binding NifX family protein